MGIWTDIAQWVGPTPNRGGAMIEWRGVVIHIAEGSYEGTISWQKNDSSNVSSHFIVAKDGRIAQMVDTDQVAWTQAGGNGRWLSIENEGFSGQSLTPAQLEANAKIIAKAHKIYGFPLVLAESPTAKGIGWHGMGGTAWGNHPNCPGVPIRNQRPEMIVVAQRIIDGVVTAPQGDDDMVMYGVYPGNQTVWAGNGVQCRPVSTEAGIIGGFASVVNYSSAAALFDRIGHPIQSSLDLNAIRTIVREELAKDPGVTPDEVAAIAAATAAAAEQGAADALDDVTVTATIQRPE